LQKRAQEFIAGRQFEKAKQSLSALIERSPDNQPAFVKFGEILLKTGHPQDALTFLSIAQALKSDDPRCTKDITLAEGLLSSRPRNFGISNLESFPSLLNDKLSSSFSGNAASIVEKGVRLWTLGCPEQAAYLFKYATKCDHTSAVAYFDLGLYYECKGDLQQALSCYEQASSMAKSRRSLFGWTSEIAKAEADVRAKLGANVQSGNEHLLNATAVEQRFRDSVAAASSSCGGCRLFFLVRTKKLDAT
jgi:tetratricopeptide (TPR) repeat protein